MTFPEAEVQPRGRGEIQLQCLPSGAFWCGVAFPSLRECSRQDYLSKRGLQQIELRKESTDYEALFRGMKVFKRKRKELEFKKDVLRLAEERMNVEDRYDGFLFLKTSSQSKENLNTRFSTLSSSPGMVQNIA